MGTFLTRWGLAALVAGATILALPATSTATFAGGNGRIFFQGPQSGTSGPADVFSIEPLGGPPTAAKSSTCARAKASRISGGSVPTAATRKT